MTIGDPDPVVGHGSNEPLQKTYQDTPTLAISPDYRGRKRPSILEDHYKQILEIIKNDPDQSGLSESEKKLISELGVSEIWENYQQSNVTKRMKKMKRLNKTKNTASTKEKEIDDTHFDTLVDYFKASRVKQREFIRKEAKSLSKQLKRKISSNADQSNVTKSSNPQEMSLYARAKTIRKVLKKKEEQPAEILEDLDTIEDVE